MIPMLVLILHITCHAFEWRCGIDELDTTLFERAMPLSQARSKSGSPRESIRIHFDYAFIDDPSLLGKGRYCSEVGENASLEGFSPFECLEGDLMTDDKRAVIKETCENVRLFFENILKIERLDGPFDLKSDTIYPANQTTTDGQTDLYITVYPKPYGAGETILAAATTNGMFADTGRAIQGIMMLNLALLPLVPSNFSTIGNRNFFEILAHETTHILAVSQVLFPKWVDIRTGKPYDPLPKYSFTKLGNTFTILHTPKLHEVLSERWGIEYFDNNESLPVGVEIEDTGGSGTRNNHWKLRMFYNELMVGASYGTMRITNISLSAFEDTGWYDVDYSIAETLDWGDYRSTMCMEQSDLQDFAVGVPAKTWPDNYVIKDRNQIPESGLIEDCTYDHRSIGYVQAYPRGSCENKTGPCQFPDYYDANNLGYYGLPAFDYALVLRPKTPCTWDVEHPDDDGSYFGEGAMCARKKNPDSTIEPTCFKMSCENMRLSIFVGNESRSCTFANEELTFSTISNTVLCPDPRIVCGVLNYGEWQANPDPAVCVTPTPSPTPTPVPEPAEGGAGLSSLQIALIAVSAVVVVVIIVVVVLLVLHRVKQRKMGEFVLFQ